MRGFILILVQFFVLFLDTQLAKKKRGNLHDGNYTTVQQSASPSSGDHGPF